MQQSLFRPKAPKTPIWPDRPILYFPTWLFLGREDLQLILGPQWPPPSHQSQVKRGWSGALSLLPSLQVATTKVSSIFGFSHQFWSTICSSLFHDTNDLLIAIFFCRPCNKFKGTLVSAVGWAQGQVGFLDFLTQHLSIETKIKLNHCCKNCISSCVLEGRCKHGTLAGRDHFGFDHWGGTHQRWEVLFHGWRGGAF